MARSAHYKKRVSATGGSSSGTIRVTHTLALTQSTHDPLLLPRLRDRRRPHSLLIVPKRLLQRPVVVRLRVRLRSRLRVILTRRFGDGCDDRTRLPGGPGGVRSGGLGGARGRRGEGRLGIVLVGGLLCCVGIIVAEGGVVMVFRHFLRSGWRWEGQEMRGSERSCDKSQEGPMPEPEEPSRRSNEAVASKMAAV